jgi:hypothetical protein
MHDQVDVASEAWVVIFRSAEDGLAQREFRETLNRSKDCQAQRTRGGHDGVLAMRFVIP